MNLCLNQLIHHPPEIPLRFTYKNSTSYTKKSDFTVLPTEFDASTKLKISNKCLQKFMRSTCLGVHTHGYLFWVTNRCMLSWISSQVCLDDPYTMWMALVMACFEENLQGIWRVSPSQHFSSTLDKNFWIGLN